MKSEKRNNPFMNCLLSCLAVVSAEMAFGEMPRPSSLPGGSQYELVPWTAGWHTAKADAEARGGHLATITSEAEWAEICRLFTPGELTGTWLGATDEESEGHWEWVTGEPFAFSRWSAGEPNNAGGEEHYLGFRYTPSPSWNDFSDPNWYMTKYLLEYDDGCVPSITSKTTATSLLFKTGRRIDCKVLSYSNGVFEVQLEDGSVRQAPAGNIQSIVFAEKEKAYPKLATLSVAGRSMEKDAFPQVATTSEGAKITKPESADAGKDNPSDSAYTPGIDLSVHGYNESPSMTNHDLTREAKKDGMKYITVDIQVVNNSKKAIPVSWGTFKLRAQDGTICDSTIWVPEIRYMRETNVRPGDKAKGRIGFLVPIGIVMPHSHVRYNTYSMYSDWVPVR